MTTLLPPCEDIETESPQDLTDLLAASLRDMATGLRFELEDRPGLNKFRCACADMRTSPRCKACRLRKAERDLAYYDAERAEAAGFGRDEREREASDAR